MTKTEKMTTKTPKNFNVIDLLDRNASKFRWYCNISTGHTSSLWTFLDFKIGYVKHWEI